MRTRKFPALIALLTAVVALTAGAAIAQTAEYEIVLVADETLTNTRSITSATITQQIATGETGTLDSAMLAEVQEVQATGTNWSVDTSLEDLSDGTNTIDLTRIQLSPDTTVPVSLSSGGEALDLTGSGVTTSAGTTGNYADADDNGVSDVKTFYSVTQDTGKAYTGFYTGTGTLATDLTGIFDLATGTYSSTVTFTLNQ